MALWILPKGWLVCWGKSQCANAGRHKIELKKSAVGKIKNTEGSGKRVGLPVVQMYVLKILFTCQIVKRFSLSVGLLSAVSVSFYACS